MTLLVITYDTNTGNILDFRHEADHEYSPESNEIIVDHGDGRRLDGKIVDIETEELIDDSEYEWKRPGVVDTETKNLIAEKFRERGASAIQNRNEIQNNNNIPQEVKDYIDDDIAMSYLVYVSLTGDRIESIEDTFFS